MKRKLTLKKSIKKYKSPLVYLREIFKAHKNEIVAGLSEALDIENAANSEYLKAHIYDTFKKNIFDLAGKKDGDKNFKITPEQMLAAIKQYEKSVLFRSAKTRDFENVRAALKNHGLWEEFRRLNGRQVWEEDRLEYTGNKTYIYHGVRHDIVISFKDSPVQIIMYRIQKDTENK